MSSCTTISCDHKGCTNSIASQGPMYANDYPGWRVKTVRGVIRHRCPKHRHDWKIDP